jgi:ribosome-associated toxin RatA of RatAB toxin-antitoxin module
VTVTETSLEIAAPADAVYALAADTAHWPLRLPHYRYVRVLERSGARQTVVMACWRDVFPLRWIAEQTNDAASPHIAFHHIAGPTRGMDVEWQFAPSAGSTRVTIVHRLAFAFPVAADFLGEHVVGAYFIAGVAERTLGCMKRIAEAAAR